MKKIYYYFDLKQESPLRISSGEGQESDSDLLTDGRGLPYIPGSGLAGVIRSYIDKKNADIIFGNVDIEKLMEKEKGAVLESRIQISDAVMKSDVSTSNIIVCIRDGVGLDDWGMNIRGAKYDFQVVETNETYYAVLEWSGDKEQEEKEIIRVLEPVFKEFVANGLQFGARTTRGYGAMKVKIYKKEFLFSDDPKKNPDVLEEWLNYHPAEKRFEEKKGDELSAPEGGIRKNISIKAGLKFKDSFNIRVRTSRLERIEDGSKPDCIPLMNKDGKPVILGTAWAGSFRHHMHHLMEEMESDCEKRGKMINEIDYELFGMGSEKKQNHRRSKITFFETIVEGGAANTSMRNAVDRFTAAPRNAALFTSQVWTGGRGELSILIDKDKVDDNQLQLIFATIYDMDLGLVTVGGETGIGRGMVELTGLQIDGVDCLDRLRAGSLKLV